MVKKTTSIAFALMLSIGLSACASKGHDTADSTPAKATTPVATTSPTSEENAIRGSSATKKSLDKKTTGKKK